MRSLVRAHVLTEQFVERQSRFNFIFLESVVSTSETRVFWCSSFNSEIDPYDSCIARADGSEGAEILE